MSQDSKKQTNPKREKLIDLSIAARELRDSGEIEVADDATINSILIEFFYTDDDHIEFNTFNQWKKMGATIVKGSIAFSVWGQPIKALDKEIDTTGMSEEEIERAKYKYWPMCHLFSNAQIVFPADEKQPDETKELPQEVQEPAGVVEMDEFF